MGELDDTIAEVQHQVWAQMEAWAQQGPEAIEHFLTYIAEDFTGFGTGPGDYISGRNALRSLTEREQEYLIYPFSIRKQWIHVRILNDTLALVEVEFDLEIQAEKDLVIMTIRCSMVLELQSGEWLTIHGHYSMPDSMQEKGGTLMDVLRARNQQLELEVAKRTAELNQSLDELKATQARLVHQEKMASLGALTAGIAHEIKNPLNFVNNFAELSIDLAKDVEDSLEEGEDVSELLEDLKRNAVLIKQHGRRADSIVRSMMAHAASARARDRVPTNVNALLDEYIAYAYQERKAQHPDFESQVSCEYDSSLNSIELAPGEMGRVFMNVLSNAFDAVQQQGEPKVTVTTRQVEGFVEIEIKDNGPGVDDAIQEKIFEPFYTTKPTGSGIGLGLSLAYDIVTHGYGGSLVLSNREEGASFLIRLPI